MRFRVFKKYMCGEDLTKFQLERGAARGWRVLAMSAMQAVHVLPALPAR